MELFLTIALALILLGMIVTLLRNPKEIAGDLFIGILRRTFLPITWIYDLWKSSRDQGRIEEATRARVEEQNPDVMVELPPGEFHFFLLIKGDYPDTVLLDDLKKATRWMGASRIGYEHKALKDAQLFQFSGLPYVAQCHDLMMNMSKLYGTANTYGYFDSSSLQAAVTVENENPNILLGRLQDGREVVRDGFVLDPESNAFINSEKIGLEKWLTVEFFEHLFQSR